MGWTPVDSLPAIVWTLTAFPSFISHFTLVIFLLA